MQPFGVLEVPPGYQEHRTVATGNEEFSEAEREQDSDDHNVEAQDGSSVTALV